MAASQAMRDGFDTATGDLIVFVDADIRNFDERFVVGLLGPLLSRPGLALVKATYRRPLILADPVGSSRSCRHSRHQSICGGCLARAVPMMQDATCTPWEGRYLSPAAQPAVLPDGLVAADTRKTIDRPSLTP